MPPQQPQQNQLDPTVVNLAKSIRTVESNGNFQAKGASGEYGAYQYTEPTWNADAKKYGVNVPLQQATPEQQNEVAYKKLSDLKSQGLNVGQIASVWNSGDPSAYQGKFSDGSPATGTNSKGVKFDVPQYAKSVASIYQQYKAGITPNHVPSTASTVGGSSEEQPQNQTNQDPSLGSELMGRLSDAGNALQDASQGKINPVSGVIQALGAGGGAVGDVVNKGLELIPGVKWLENEIGSGVGKLAQTPVGQSVANSIKTFSQAHPELSSDIGAGFNIATAIPIFEGLGAVKDLAFSATGRALEGVAEKGAIGDLTNIASATKAGRTILQNDPEVLKDMVSERLIPEIENGKLSTAALTDQSWDKVNDLNKQLDPILNSDKYAQIGQNGENIAQKAIDGYTDRNGIKVPGMPNAGISTQELIDNAKSLDPMNKLLWEKFEAGQANVSEINKLRSSLDSKVKSVFTDAPTVSNAKELGANLSGAMRDYVQSKVPESQQIFKDMAKQFRIQKAFKVLEGKALKTGLLRKTAQRIVGTGVGALGGRMLGGGLVGEGLGGLVGEEASGLLNRRSVGGVLGKTLLKEGESAVPKNIAKKGAKLAGGVLAQRINSSR